MDEQGYRLVILLAIHKKLLLTELIPPGLPIAHKELRAIALVMQPAQEEKPALLAKLKQLVYLFTVYIYP